MKQKKTKPLGAELCQRTSWGRPKYVSVLPGKAAGFLAKLRLGTLPVAHELNKRAYYQDTRCPACACTDETLEHFLMECSGLEKERQRLWRLTTNPTMDWLISDVREHGEGSTGGARVWGLYQMWRRRCELLTPEPARTRRNTQDPESTRPESTCTHL